MMYLKGAILLMVVIITIIAKQMQKVLAYQQQLGMLEKVIHQYYYQYSCYCYCYYQKDYIIERLIVTKIADCQYCQEHKLITQILLLFEIGIVIMLKEAILETKKKDTVIAI